MSGATEVQRRSPLSPSEPAGSTAAYSPADGYEDELAVPLESAGRPQAEPEPASVPIYQKNTPPGARKGVFFTVVLSTTVNPVQLLLGRDYKRAKAVIIAVDEPVVLAQSQAMAENANNTNQATAGAVPSGAYVPVGICYPIDHCDEVWVAATSSSAGRVSVVVSRGEG
jgi:hypothetical protein